MDFKIHLSIAVVGVLLMTVAQWRVQVISSKKLLSTEFKTEGGERALFLYLQVGMEQPRGTNVILMATQTRYTLSQSQLLTIKVYILTIQSLVLL